MVIDVQLTVCPWGDSSKVLFSQSLKLQAHDFWVIPNGVDVVLFDLQTNWKKINYLFPPYLVQNSRAEANCLQHSHLERGSH